MQNQHKNRKINHHLGDFGLCTLESFSGLGMGILSKAELYSKPGRTSTWLLPWYH